MRDLSGVKCIAADDKTQVLLLVAAWDVGSQSSRSLTWHLAVFSAPIIHRYG
ncbi:hypothetical protein AGMMS49942_11350 [Spirochaetia bacterium]|nr:hypothetical protein AGMMS49942_11350 [Spirochaetia bacterium]